MQNAAVECVPPTRDGVGPSCVSLPPGPWATITDFLVHRFPAQARAVWLRRMQRGEVIDACGTRISEEHAYRSPMRVYYYRTLDHEAAIPFQEQVLYQDEHLLVADKPHFLPVVPSGGYLQETLLVRLKRKLGIDTLVPIHRIDRDTAGLVLFSIAPATRDRYHALFRDRLVRKTYQAIADWNAGIEFPLTRTSRIAASTHFMQQQEVPGAPNATTHIRLLRTDERNGHYELEPVTGRRHQLRVHMAALGLPIEGDALYPGLRPQAPPDYRAPLRLLAKSIAFTDPLSGMLRRFDSPRELHLTGDGIGAGSR